MDRLNLFVPKPVTAAVVVILVSFAVYSGVLSNGLVYDDTFLVLENPWIKTFSSIPDIFTSPLWSFEFDNPQNYYRPVIHLIYMAAYQLSGSDAWGYQLAKVLLHAGSALFVFLIASTIFASTISKRDSNNKTIAAFFLAALSKETALMLPAAMIAYDYALKKSAVSLATARRYVPYAVVIVIYFILRTNAIGGVLPPQKVHADL